MIPGRLEGQYKTIRPNDDDEEENLNMMIPSLMQENVDEITPDIDANNYEAF